MLEAGVVAGYLGVVGAWEMLRRDGLVSGRPGRGGT
jgi:hypothetical protein